MQQTRVPERTPRKLCQVVVTFVAEMVLQEEIGELRTVRPGRSLYIRKVVVGDSSSCDTCGGQGAVMEVRQIGPGMITQMQRTCSKCQGQGFIAKMKNERKVVEVHVEKGAVHNQKITFRGMADELPGRETGDVHFIVQEKDHDIFKRKGADLLVMKDISLNQALTGYSVRIS